MARVLIVGCGYVGSVLGRLLVTEGHLVWGLRRDSADLPTGVQPLRADVTRPEGFGALPERLDSVVYAVGAKAHQEASYRAVYLDGLGNLLRVLGDEGHRLGRIFFASSTAVYGHARGEWVDERSPTHPTDFAGEILLVAERLLQGSSFPSTVVRFARIYGPGRASLIERVRSGRLAPPRDGVRYTNRIHRDDAAGALAHLIGMAEPAPVYLAADCEPVKEAELWHWLAAELGVEPSAAPMEEVARPGRRSSSKRCRNDLLRSAGYRFGYPTFREGYAELIRGLASPGRDRGGSDERSGG